MNGPDNADGTVAAVLRLTDLAARIEQVNGDSTRRIDDLARDCATALQQVTGLRDELGNLGGRAEGIEQRLAEVGDLLGHMSNQIAALTAAGEQPQDSGPAYQVNPAPPWWKPDADLCQDTRERLRDWVDQVYRPVFGYLADLLAPCWERHPVCLAYLDVLHEAWCLLYIPPRDPKTVFAQLDWLTRPLLQATEVIAAETRRCRDGGRHRDPGAATPLRPASWTGTRP